MMISQERLVAMPDSRFKPYKRKVQKAYFLAKAKFERDKTFSRQLLFDYEDTYSAYSTMLKAQKLRK